MILTPAYAEADANQVGLAYSHARNAQNKSVQKTNTYLRLIQNVCLQVFWTIRNQKNSAEITRSQIKQEFQNPRQGFRTSKPYWVRRLAPLCRPASAAMSGRSPAERPIFAVWSTILLKRLPADVLGVSVCAWQAARSLTPKYEKRSKTSACRRFGSVCVHMVSSKKLNPKLFLDFGVKDFSGLGLTILISKKQCFR